LGFLSTNNLAILTWQQIKESHLLIASLKLEKDEPAILKLIAEAEKLINRGANFNSAELIFHK
jgi:hypothetical protein